MEKSISNGRKIFRFLKFLEDYKKLKSYIFKSKNFDKNAVFKIVISLFAMFYHFLENIVLLNNLGILQENITEGFNWKTGKNFFSLLESLLKYINIVFELINLSKQQNFSTNSFKNVHLKNMDNINYHNNSLYKEYSQDFDNELDNKITNMSFKNNYNMENNKKKFKKLYLSLIESFTKIIMRLSSLKVKPVYSYLHPVLSCLISIANCLCSLKLKYDKEVNSEEEKALDIYNKIKKSKTNLNNFNNNSSLNKLNTNDDIKLKNEKIKTYFIDKNSFFMFDRKMSFEMILCLNKIENVELTRLKSSKLINYHKNNKLYNKIVVDKLNKTNYFSDDELYYLLDDSYYHNYFIEFGSDFPTNPVEVYNYN